MPTVHTVTLFFKKRKTKEVRRVNILGWMHILDRNIEKGGMKEEC